MKPKLRTYIVTRHGSNTANQSMCQSMDIGFVDARGPDHAWQLAQQEFGDACYNNQHLTVTAAGKVSALRYNSLVEEVSRHNAERSVA